MEDRHAEQINKIYQGIDNIVIDSLDIPNAFGKGYKAYEQVVERLVDLVPKIANNVMEHYGL